MISFTVKPCQPASQPIVSNSACKPALALNSPAKKLDNKKQVNVEDVLKRKIEQTNSQIHQLLNSAIGQQNSEHCEVKLDLNRSEVVGLEDLIDSSLPAELDPEQQANLKLLLKAQSHLQLA